MDSNLAQSLAIPHLRLARHASPQLDDSFDTPQAGPSRTTHNPGKYKGGDRHEQYTSKPASTTSFEPSRSSHSPQDAPSADTPAARLRALLSRIPNNPTSKAPSRSESPPSISEIESDFDPPQSSPATSSVARESLKDLFSRALRDPGETPTKERRRRNSIDISEVDATPRVARERAKNKGKRRSLSDEEAEKPSKSSQRSEASFRSSHAANFDSLRERLVNSHAKAKKPVPLGQCDSDAQDDNNYILHDLNSSQETPVATSTPQKSLQFPSQLHFQSNLLENDSEMQNAMKGFESFEADLASSSQPLSFPLPHTHQSMPARPRLTTSPFHSHNRTHSEEHISSHSSRTTRDDGTFSRPNSSQHHEHDREREWDSHHVKTSRNPSTPASRQPLPGSQSAVVGMRNELSRRGGSVSLRGIDGDTSPRASSIVSQTEYHDRVNDFAKQRNLEREREWNKRPPSASSNSSLHPPPERSRTYSHPTRPQSSHSNSRSPTPDRSVHPRSSAESESESVTETHLRERNWNDPNWDGHHSPPSHTSLPLHHQSHPSSHHRVHAETPSHASKPISRHSSNQTSTKVTNADTYPMRSGSPLPPLSDPEIFGSSKVPPSVSRFEWQFLRSRTPLPPLELDEPSQEHRVPLDESHSDLSSPTPSSRSASRMSISLATSRVPEISSKRHPEGALKQASPVLLNGHDKQSRRSHKRMAAELIGTVAIKSDKGTSVWESDKERRSTIKHDIPSPAPPESTAPRSHHSRDQSRYQNVFASTAFNHGTTLPPLSPEASDLQSPTTLLPLSTPPRRSSFTSSKIEFKSPSPPKNLPELPEPPTSEDEAAFEHERSSWRPNGDARADITAMSTPRPPGAWTSTPARSRHRANSLPSEAGDFQYSNTRATPVASLSRAGSLPPPTPAPPGGWVATPSRRSILKVRFDIEHPESEISVSESGGEPSRYLPGALRESPRDDHESGKVTAFDSASLAPTDVEGEDHWRQRTPATSTPVSPRSLRKAPTIRLVDAYGAEQGSDDGQTDVSAHASAKANASLRNKSAIRIVDAMGRRVEDTPVAVAESVHENDIPLNHNEAVARVRQGLVELLNGFDERDRSNENLQLDDQRLMKLENESREARIKRKQLSQSLLSTQTGANDDLTSKYRPFKASMSMLPIDAGQLPCARVNRWIFWGLVVFQLLLVLVMYRLSTVRARNLFLTTYYDPFYADLHSYATKPDTNVYLSSPASPTPWSMTSAIGTFRRDGWSAVTAELQNSFSQWLRTAWSVDECGREAWPPT